MWGNILFIIGVTLLVALGLVELYSKIGIKAVILAIAILATATGLALSEL